MPQRNPDKPSRTRLHHSKHLTGAKRFQLVMRKGKRARSPQFEMFWLAHADGSRLGMIVGRPVGIAVQRNRLKRVIREWYRQGRTELPSGDWIVRVFRAAVALSTQEIWNDLTRLAQSATKRAA